MVGTAQGVKSSKNTWEDRPNTGAASSTKIPSIPAIPRKVATSRIYREEKPLANVPYDFYESALIHLGKVHGEAMQVLWDDRIIDPIPKGLTELERLERLSQTIMRWASGWGGVAYWPETLDLAYARACKEGQQGQWQEDLVNHASVGRRLLVQLHSMGGRLPKERYKTRELWRSQVSLVEMLVMGITTINIRCSVFPHHHIPELFPLVPYSDDESGSDGESGRIDNAGRYSGDGDDEDSLSE